MRAALTADAPGLVVLHAGADHFTGGPALPWAQDLAVSGRRQHAKAALLRYRSPSGGKDRTKVIVTSANLTRGGLTSNLEVMTWDEHGRAATPFLGVDLLKEIRALAALLPGREVLRPVLRALGTALKGLEPTGELRSSLVSERTMVPPRRRRDAPASRIVIVSPAFAGNTDTKAAAALAPWCGPETAVDIYAPFAGTRAVAETGEVPLELSKGLLTGLRSTGAAVTVHAIPAADDAGTTRRLHAKVLAITSSDGSTVLLAGSANCTGPGLEGRNRELMVRRRSTRRQLQGLLDGLGSVPFNGPIEPPSRKVPKPTVASAGAVTAVFEIDPTVRADDGIWTGTLTITVDPAEPVTKAFYNGQPIAVGEPVRLTFHPARGTIEVHSGRRSHFTQVQVQAPEVEGGFWNRLTPERSLDQPDQDLIRLLGDVNRPAKKRPAASATSAKTAGTSADGFTIPLSQRLVIIARLRRNLSDHRHADMAEFLDRYLDARTVGEAKAGIRAEEVAASRAVALAVHGAYDPTAKRPRIPLLAALQDAAIAFDEHLAAEQEDR